MTRASLLGLALLFSGCITYEVGSSTRKVFAAQAKAGSPPGAASHFTTQDVKALFGTSTPTGEKKLAPQIGESRERTPVDVETSSTGE